MKSNRFHPHFEFSPFTFWIIFFVRANEAVTPVFLYSGEG